MTEKKVEKKTGGCACGCGKHIGVAIVAAVIAGAVAFGGCYMACHGKKAVIVNFEQVKQEAEAYKSILAEQRKYEEKLQAQMGLDIGALQKEDAALAAKKEKMKEADYQKEVVVLQKKAAELQQKYRYQAQQILGASQMAAEKIQADVEKTLETVATKAGAGVVLNAAVVVYANDDTNNITDCFVKELNKTVKPVAYPDPATVKLTAGE